MTCLYCGKKLGFFSRYKDTPFCSEEHLRSHQDELEHALMERLGSKASNAPALRSGGPVPISERPFGKGAVELDVTANHPTTIAPALHQGERREHTDRDSSSRDNSNRDSSNRETATPRQESPAPAPLCDEFFADFPQSVPALHVSKPLLPSSSFAIIVQADCCTPSTPDFEGRFIMPLSTEDFDLESTSLPQSIFSSADSVMPPAHGAEAFGEPWLLFPDSGPLELETEFNPSLNLSPLEYDVLPDAPGCKPLGQRDALVPRPRNRFPYAANELASPLNSLEAPILLFDLSAATDWDAIEPAAVASPTPEPCATTAEPFTAIPLSIGVPDRSLCVASAADASACLCFATHPLDGSAGLHLGCADDPWNAAPLLPIPATDRPLMRSWGRADCEDRVPPVPFPSLFQLGPVLPPRPEHSAS